MSLVVTARTDQVPGTGARALSSHVFDSTTPVELVSADARAVLDAAEVAFEGKAHLAGPCPHAEISGFWPSVQEEIFLGNLSQRRRPFDRQAVELFRLDEIMERDPRTLSGGEAARVVLASRLISEPAVLLVEGLFEEIDIATRYKLSSHLSAGHLSTLLVGLAPLSIPGRRVRWDLDSDTLAVTNDALPLIQDGWSRASLTVEVLNTREARMGTLMFEVIGLSCHRGGRLVFEDVSFSSQGGSIGLILGPNGAGKTSLIECIAGMLPFGGRISINNDDIRGRFAKSAAYAPQDADEDVVEKSLLGEVALAAGSIRAQELLKSCRIPPNVWEEPLAGDGGLKKIASVMSAVGRNRPLCLLDEPTLSCDLEKKAWIVAAISHHDRRGGISLVSSHDGEFLDMLAAMI